MCWGPLSKRVDGAGGLRSVDSAKPRRSQTAVSSQDVERKYEMLEKSVPVHESATLPRLSQFNLRQDGQLDSYTPVSEDSSLQSSVVSAGREMHALKRGLLWQQRDRIFSRWKERYFILTKDYLHCFKRSSGIYNISPMGQFIFKVKLVELEKVEWLNKKSYSAIGLALQGRESKILLRASSGLEDWFELLEECTIASKERRIALRKLHDPNWGSDDSPYSRADWISTTDSHKTDTASLMESVLKRRSRCGPEIDLWPRANHDNRLSLMTDIDINSWGSTPPPSAPSTFRGRPYRFNTDVFFLPQGGTNTATMSSGRSLITPVASFRNGQFPPHNHQNMNTSMNKNGHVMNTSSMNKNGHVMNTSSMNKNVHVLNTSSMNKNGHVINTSSMNKNGHVIRYRERSQSDALNKIRAPDIENKRASYVSTVLSQI